MGTYNTDTSTWQMQTLRYFLIVSGLLVISGDGYKYFSGLDYSYLNLLSGGCFLFMGIRFSQMFKNISITIDQRAISNYYPATRFERAHKEKSNWDNIKKILLHNFSVQVIEKRSYPSYTNSLNKKFRLPIYNYNQFQKIKSHLKNLSEANDTPFEIRSWW